MHTSTVFAVCSPVALALALSGNAHAGGWADMLDSTARDASSSVNQANEAVNVIDQGMQTLQPEQQALNAMQGSPEAGLTGMLMQRFNVSQVQAESGAGALFQLAKSRMTEESFNQLSLAVPEIQNLLNAVPVVNQSPAGLSGLAGGVSSMTGLPGDALSGLDSLAGAFQQLGMSGDMARQFVPVLVDYVRGSSGDPLANALMSALTSP
ncbi:MAG: DUF2780 domain-containing protein [Gammaproteobacteria bacterium]